MIHLPRLKRKNRQRPVLLLIDVSGSMKERTDAICVSPTRSRRRRTQVEVFTFGTRLTRITRALKLKRRDQALAAASGMVADWDGGTRIGDALQAFLAVPRFVGLARSALTLILSDGLERGDHTAMTDAVIRLSRCAWRLHWLTPLATGPDFSRRRRRSNPSALTSTTWRTRAPWSASAPTFSSCPMEKRHDRHHRRTPPHLASGRPALAQGPMQPRIFGPYEPIRRDYPMSEFLEDIAETGVTKSVYVQANWAPDRFEDEVAWVQAQADETGWPHGIVGYADFLSEDVRPQLDRLKAYPLMRGVRMQLHWHENEMYRFASNPDLCLDETLQRNVAHLADYGWSFDLQVFAGQMTGAAQLAMACPDVTFILQHAGMLEDTSDAGRSAWHTGMAMLATCPNVVSKLSGLRHLHSQRTTSATSPASSRRRSRCSGRSAVCSARTFRSRSFGPAMRT